MIHKFNIDNTYIVIDANSGAIHEVDKLVYDILDYYKEKSNEEIISLLRDRYSKDEIQEAIMEITGLENNDLLYTDDEYTGLVKESNREPIIKALCLHISHDCNIRCKYCFASYGHFGGNRGLMPIEVGKMAVDFLIKNSRNRKNLEIDFFGGEPLLNFDTIRQIIEYAKEREKQHNKYFRFTLTTNALLINHQIKEYINENMYNVVLSIDGRKDVNDNMRVKINGNGTYDDILPKIKEIADSRNQENYYVRGTYTSHNIDFSKDVIHLANLGLKQIGLEPVVAEESLDYALKEEHLPILFDQYEKLAKEYLKRINTSNEFDFYGFTIDLDNGPCAIKRLKGCGAGSEYLAITPNGDIYPCHQFVDIKEYKMGSLNDNKINLEVYKQFADNTVYTKEDCKQCWSKFFCSGGCHANAYKFNKSIKSPYKIGCELQKKTIECAIYIAVKKGERYEKTVI